MAYRVYVTDALQILGGLDRRYIDIIDPPPEDPRGAEEIKNDITSKLRKMQNNQNKG